MAGRHFRQAADGVFEHVRAVRGPLASAFGYAIRQRDALRRFLSEERDLDLGPVALLPAGSFVIEARVEVNPLSSEQLQRTREFIATPAGGARGAGGSRSVLGAMASFLLREPDPGSDVVLLRSRPFGPGEVAAR